MILPYPSGFWDFADSPFLPAFFVKNKKGHGYLPWPFYQNKKAMGAYPAHPWLSLYSTRLRGMGEPS
jgi:hypothetical protein